MLQGDYFYSVEQKGQLFNNKCLYKFKIDREDIPANTIKPWQGNARDAL